MAVAALGERNLALLAERAFERRGAYDSLLFEGRWHDSTELFERTLRLGAGLAARGVAPGDRVVVTMANCPEVGIAYNALWRAGAVVTPAIFLLPAEELRYVIANAEACAVITSPELAPKMSEAVEGLDCVRFVACTGEVDGYVQIAELEQAGPGSIAPRRDGDLAALLYTGGTTGQSKGVMLSHANLNYTARAAHDAAHVPGLDRGISTLPLSHAYGLLVTIAALHSPERTVTALLRWFDPTVFLSLIEEHRLELAACVPSMLQILLSQPLEDYNLSSLRYVSSGGAPLAPEVEEEFSRRVQSASIRQGYGLTETAALVSANPVGREKPGSVGIPVPGTELRIVDAGGRQLPVGSQGEIMCRSPGVMGGYWRDPAATAETLRDGWLYTGDIGYLDDEGYLFIVDRKKDVIMRGGFSVYPRDLEHALLAHPAVQVAGVVGRPDRVAGEEVVAFVSLHPGSEVSEEQLVAWAREHIGGYKYPRELHILDALPVTAVGKINRRELRARAALGSA